MKLSIIVLCLLAEYYLPQLERLRRQDWFSQLLQRLKAQFPGVPPLLMLTSLVLLLCVLLWGVLHVGVGIGFILQAIILFFCLGPESYLPGVDSQQVLLPELYFEQANRQFFGPLFWYMVLGIEGAVIYRFLDLASKEPDCGPSAMQLMAYVDWIPARLTGILYLLVGNFDQGYPFLMNHVATGVTENAAFLSGCGFHAAHQDKQEEVSGVQAKQLVWHAVILFLVGVAGLTLAALW